MEATSPATRKYSITPLSPVLGIEVDGIDIANLSDEGLDSIKSLFLKHHLLVFRDQMLSDADIQAFAESFGPLEVNQVRGADGAVLPAVHAIANVDSQGRPSSSPLLKANYNWHTDKAYLKTPSLMTLLWGQEIPPVGGDTQFSNVELAYADLPAETKKHLEGLRVIQSFRYMLDGLGQHDIIDPKDIPPPVEHPLVRVHPETGNKSLFVSMYSSAIVGMEEAEARALIAELLAHATQEKYVFTQRWKKHDFVVWDNRSLLHRAIPNYDMGSHRRVLRRCVVRGGVPQ